MPVNIEEEIILCAASLTRSFALGISGKVY